MQSLTERICREFISHIGAGSQSPQPIRIGDALANGGCDARRTRFFKNDPVATVLDHPATTFGGNDRQAERLRFELCHRKSIRQGWKYEYIGSFVLFSCLLPRHRAKPFYSRILCCCFCIRDLNSPISGELFDGMKMADAIFFDGTFGVTTSCVPSGHGRQPADDCPRLRPGDPAPLSLTIPARLRVHGAVSLNAEG